MKLFNVKVVISIIITIIDIKSTASYKTKNAVNFNDTNQILNHTYQDTISTKNVIVVPTSKNVTNNTTTTTTTTTNTMLNDTINEEFKNGHMKTTDDTSIFTTTDYFPNDTYDDNTSTLKKNTLKTNNYFLCFYYEKNNNQYCIDWKNKYDNDSILCFLRQTDKWIFYSDDYDLAKNGNFSCYKYERECFPYIFQTYADRHVVLCSSCMDVNHQVCFNWSSTFNKIFDWSSISIENNDTFCPYSNKEDRCFDWTEVEDLLEIDNTIIYTTTTTTTNSSFTNNIGDINNNTSSIEEVFLTKSLNYNENTYTTNSNKLDTYSNLFICFYKKKEDKFCYNWSNEYNNDSYICFSLRKSKGYPKNLDKQEKDVLCNTFEYCINNWVLNKGEHWFYRQNILCPCPNSQEFCFIWTGTQAELFDWPSLIQLNQNNFCPYDNINKTCLDWISTKNIFSYKNDDIYTNSGNIVFICLILISSCLIIVEVICSIFILPGKK
nr:MAG: hypothetical protein [Metapenaeopsis lamellata majanivirus]